MNADYDNADYKVAAVNRWLSSLWTEPNAYPWSLFWKYYSEQEGRPSGGVALNPDVTAESWGVGAIVELLRELKLLYNGAGVYQAPFAQVEAAFSQATVGNPDMLDYYGRFLVALYTKHLGDPFHNLPPDALGSGVPFDLTPRWDFVEDSLAGYNELTLSQDGTLLEKDQVLTFHNDQSAYANGEVGFIHFGQSEPIRVDVATDVVVVHFEGQHPAESFAAGKLEDVGFAGLVHYTRIDGTGNYIRVLEGLEQTSQLQFALYGNLIGYPYSEYRAKHIVIFPFSWNPELRSGTAQGATGRHYKFKLRGGPPPY